MPLPPLTENGELPRIQHLCARFWIGSVPAPTNGRRWPSASTSISSWSWETPSTRPNGGEAPILFDHAAAQAHFGASVFWLRRLAAWPNEQAAVEFWQVKRGGGRRGIVEVTRAEAS